MAGAACCIQKPLTDSDDEDEFTPEVLEAPEVSSYVTETQALLGRRTTGNQANRKYHGPETLCNGDLRQDNCPDVDYTPDVYVGPSCDENNAEQTHHVVPGDLTQKKQSKAEFSSENCGFISDQGDAGCDVTTADPEHSDIIRAAWEKNDVTDRTTRQGATNIEPQNGVKSSKSSDDSAVLLNVNDAGICELHTGVEGDVVETSDENIQAAQSYSKSIIGRDCGEKNREPKQNGGANRTRRLNVNSTAVGGDGRSESDAVNCDADFVQNGSRLSYVKPDTVEIGGSPKAAGKDRDTDAERNAAANDAVSDSNNSEEVAKETEEKMSESDTKTAEKEKENATDKKEEKTADGELNLEDDEEEEEYSSEEEVPALAKEVTILIRIKKFFGMRLDEEEKERRRVMRKRKRKKARGAAGEGEEGESDDDDDDSEEEEDDTKDKKSGKGKKKVGDDAKDGDSNYDKETDKNKGKNKNNVGDQAKDDVDEEAKDTDGDASLANAVGLNDQGDQDVDEAMSGSEGANKSAGNSGQAGALSGKDKQLTGDGVRGQGDSEEENDVTASGGLFSRGDSAASVESGATQGTGEGGQSGTRTEGGNTGLDETGQSQLGLGVAGAHAQDKEGLQNGAQSKFGIDETAQSKDGTGIQSGFELGGTDQPEGKNDPANARCGDSGQSKEGVGNGAKDGAGAGTENSYGASGTAGSQSGVSAADDLILAGIGEIGSGGVGADSLGSAADDANGRNLAGNTDGSGVGAEGQENLDGNDDQDGRQTSGHGKDGSADLTGVGCAKPSGPGVDRDSGGFDGEGKHGDSKNSGVLGEGEQDKDSGVSDATGEDTDNLKVVCRNGDQTLDDLEGNVGNKASDDIGGSRDQPDGQDASRSGDRSAGDNSAQKHGENQEGRDRDAGGAEDDVDGSAAKNRKSNTGDGAEDQGQGQDGDGGRNMGAGADGNNNADGSTRLFADAGGLAIGGREPAGVSGQTTDVISQPTDESGQAIDGNGQDGRGQGTDGNGQAIDGSCGQAIDSKNAAGHPDGSSSAPRDANGQPMDAQSFSLDAGGQAIGADGQGKDSAGLGQAGQKEAGDSEDVDEIDGAKVQEVVDREDATNQLQHAADATPGLLVIGAEGEVLNKGENEADSSANQETDYRDELGYEDLGMESGYSSMVITKETSVTVSSVRKPTSLNVTSESVTSERTTWRELPPELLMTSPAGTLSPGTPETPGGDFLEETPPLPTMHFRQDVTWDDVGLDVDSSLMTQLGVMAPGTILRLASLTFEKQEKPFVPPVLVVNFL